MASTQSLSGSAKVISMPGVSKAINTSVHIQSGTFQKPPWRFLDLHHIRMTKEAIYRYIHPNSVWKIYIAGMIQNITVWSNQITHEGIKSVTRACTDRLL